LFEEAIPDEDAPKRRRKVQDKIKVSSQEKANLLSKLTQQYTKWLEAKGGEDEKLAAFKNNESTFSKEHFDELDLGYLSELRPEDLADDCVSDVDEGIDNQND